MIRLFRVSKRYPEGVTALHEVSLHIEKGEFAFLTGPSGAGKTTLLRLLFREERPTSGQIIIDGRNLIKLPRKEVPFFRRNIGLVFQDFKLIPHWTVYENVAFALEALGTPPREIRKRVLRVLGMVGLHGKMARKAAVLSGGEQQRVAIARALVKEPKILLADEPTGNLDNEMACRIMEIFEEINTRGTTIVMATHNYELVSRYGNRVIGLDRGRVVEATERVAEGT